MRQQQLKLMDTVVFIDPHQVHYCVAEWLGGGSFVESWWKPKEDPIDWDPTTQAQWMNVKAAQGFRNLSGIRKALLGRAFRVFGHEVIPRAIPGRMQKEKKSDGEAWSTEWESKSSQWWQNSGDKGKGKGKSKGPEFTCKCGFKNRGSNAKCGGDGPMGCKCPKKEIWVRRMHHRGGRDQTSKR